MFIKCIVKTDKKTGRRYEYYRLTESYRLGGRPRHRAILNLGKLEGIKKEEHKVLADRIDEVVRGQETIFKDIDPKIEALAQHYAKIIIEERLIDIPVREREGEEKEYYEVDINSIRHEEVREIGAEWLCKQAMDKLGLEGYLRSIGWEERWIKRAVVYIISKAVYPSSERKMAEWLRLSSGLCDIYGIKDREVGRHKLYKVSKMLYKEREGIERYINEKIGGIFGIRDKIIIYDLTNTYFEGKKGKSEKARYSKSKERRDDAKLVSIGLVVDSLGFIKCSKIYEGDIRESKTLKGVIEELRGKVEGERKGIVVIDAGIAEEGNLKMLREGGYDYVCVSLSKPFKEIEGEGGVKKIKVKGGEEVEAKWVKVKGKRDNFLHIKSKGKEEKEKGMEELFCRRYEEGLKGIEEGIKRKGGIKKIELVEKRLGRLEGKYPSVYRLYEVKVEEKDGKAIDIKWKKKRGKRNGEYFIRTSMDISDEKEVWEIYNTIREIEATFRVLKADLRMRPIYHQEDEMSEAHINGSILAYSIVNMIRQGLKSKGVKYDWSNIIRIMNTQKEVCTTMKARSGHRIYIKKCSEPNKEVQEIYHHLRMRDRPFWKKKSVFPENEKSILEKVDSS